MTKIFIAADSAFGNPDWINNPFGHLQIVFDNGSGSLVETEVQANFGFFDDDPETTPTGGTWELIFDAPHTIIPDEDRSPPNDKYGIYELELSSGQDAESVWQLLKQVYEHLRNNHNDDLTYDTSGIDIGLAFESQNSNSYVRTLLDVIGNTRDWQSAFFTDGMDSFPGYDRNVLENLTGIGDSGVTLVVAGTPGNDIIIGGNNTDSIGGGGGNDTLSGGAGDDTLSGGAGKDTFLGTPDDLDGDTIVDLEVGDFIQLKGVDTADISDDFDYSVSGGVVTLSFDEGAFDFFGTTVALNMDIPKGAALKLLEDRAEATIEVVAEDGHDIAFVVDTTGSMWDDIDAVQAQATSIINAIFDPARGLLNSRVAVVGYNDPGTETLLSFTDQEDVEDRKQAALNAINSLYASGGGDFEEMVYSGLLRALDGRAGEWREDALASRIFLFGDAPAKDTELLDRVLELAADVGADVSVSTRSFALSESVSRTTLTMTAASSEADPISVEIFTIVVGGDETTRDEFDFLASETGGEALFSADATEIADVLFDAIQSGTAGSDIIIGNSRANTLDGKAGDDSITGNDGDDILFGGSGNDTVMGGNGNDRIFDGLGNNILDGGDDDDSIQALSGVNALQGGNGSDYLAGGFQSDNLSGGAGNDVLRGDSGSFLGGSDILVGGVGDDFLMGGRGADTFVFRPSEGSDVIAAFDVAEMGYGPLSGYTATATGADFQAGLDHIHLQGFEAVNASNVMSFVRDSAEGARFSAEGTDILFYGVAASQIGTDDFVFSVV